MACIGDQADVPAFSRLLVTTDFSDGSQTAVTLGIRLAAPNAALHVLHVMPDAEMHIPLLLPTKHELKKLKKEADHRRKDTEKRLTEFVAALGGGSATWEIQTGSMAAAVMRTVEAFGPDLVTVGAKGLADRQGEHAGGTARAVLRSAHASVLVGRGRIPPPEERALRIGVATDLHEPSHKAGGVAAGLAKRLEARLTVIHIADQKLWVEILSDSIHGDDGPTTWSEIQARMRKGLHDFNQTILGGEATEELVTGNPRTEIGSTAERLGLDLLVLGTQGPRTAGTAQLGSVAVETAAMAPISVLLVR